MASQPVVNHPIRRSSTSPVPPTIINRITVSSPSSSPLNEKNNSIITTNNNNKESSSQSNVRLIALIPPGPNISLNDYKPIIQASIDARYYRDQDYGLNKQNPIRTRNEVILGIDEEINAETVEIIGNKLHIDIPCRVRLPYLVLQVKDTGRFCGIELGIEDKTGKHYSLFITNKTSSARITTETCSIPLELINKQWNLLRLNLADLTNRAWGVEYHMCRGVIIHASLSIARVYFESIPMEDYELPVFLRTIQNRRK